MEPIRHALILDFPSKNQSARPRFVVPGTVLESDGSKVPKFLCPSTKRQIVDLPFE
jgi:hypothetical protein